MKDEDVKRGMKVVPHSKNGCGFPESLSSSNCWEYMGGKEQGYLYVVNIYQDRFSLSPVLDHSGDHFLASDFEPYIEPEEAEKPVKAKQIVFVRHQGQPHEYLFEVPKGLTLHVYDKVLCDTCHGDSDGVVCAGPFNMPSDTGALAYATKAYFPLKKIKGKYQLITQDAEAAHA